MKRRRGHALRRRYGRSTAGGTFEIEQSGGLFVVKLTRELQVGSAGKSVPAGTTLGTVNEKGTIKVWRSSGYVPRGYAESAKILLNDAKHDLKAAGRIMAKERARETAAEQAEGDFIAKVDGGPTLRGHDMPRLRAKVEAELLTRPVGTQAKFFRAGPSHWEDGRPLVGIPWTEPFHIEETYEWNNQKRVGMAKGGA